MTIFERINVGNREFGVRMTDEMGWRVVRGFEGEKPVTLRYGVSLESQADFVTAGHGSAIDHLVELVREDIKKVAEQEQ